MYRCTICRWEVEFDDVEIRTNSGACICLGCYGRMVGNERRMSKELRRELIAHLAGVA